MDVDDITGSCIPVTGTVGGSVELPCNKANVVWSYVGPSGRTIDVISRNFSVQPYHSLRLVPNKDGILSSSLVIYNLTQQETREYRCVDETVTEDYVVCYNVTVLGELNNRVCTFELYYDVDMRVLITCD